MNRPSWKLPSRRRIASRLFALAAAAALAPAARAAKPPDWVRAATRAAIPKLAADTAAVELYSGQQTTIDANGQVETRYRMAYKILRHKGEDYGQVVIFASKDTALVYLKGWSVAPDGTTEEVRQKDAVETDLDPDELYSDAHMFVLNIPGSVPGNVVACEYVQKGRPDIDEDDWMFQQTVPVVDARYTLRLPERWNYAVFWANHAPIDPSSPAPGVEVWELRDIPAVAVEPDMPPWRAVAGSLSVKYDSPGNAEQVEQAGSWHDLGLWYAALSAGRREPTAAIRQQVNALTANRPALLDKIRAVAAYVQQSVRYVAIEIGIGGYQPHAAGQIFADQYGDCKDKATLLSSMLSVLGVKSYYAIAQTERGIVRRDFPSLLSFDHVIVAIQLPAGTVPADLFSTVQDPKLGTLLFFDPTDPYTPFGYLPAPLQDNSVLLVAPTGGELIHLPLEPPAANRMIRTGNFTIEPNGDLSGSVQEFAWGEEAADTRGDYLHVAPVDRGKVLRRFLGVFLDNFDLESASLGNLHRIDDDFVLDYKFLAHGYARLAGNLILFRLAALGRKAPYVSGGKKRAYPVEFPSAVLETDDYRFTLPPGYVVDELPSPTNVDCGAISYHSAITAHAGFVEYRRTFTVKQVFVPVGRIAALRAAAGEIAADERASVVLRQTGN